MDPERELELEFQSRPIGVGPLRFELQSDDPAVVARFDLLFESFEAPSTGAPVIAVRIETTNGSGSGGSTTFTSTLDGDVLLSSQDIHEHELLVTRTLNQRRIDAEPELLHLHAAAVARRGRGVVIAGDSGSGKSTLTAGLLRRGWKYLTDELVVVRPTDGRVLRYPRPITLRESSWSLFPGVPGVPAGRPPVGSRSRIEVAPRSLGSVQGPRPVDVSTVIVPRLGRKDADTLAPVASAAETVELLASCCHDLERMSVAGLEVLVRIAAACHCWRLEFGTLARAVDRIEEAFDQSNGREQLAVRPIPPLASRIVPAGQIRRAPGAHGWAFGDGSTIIYHPPTRTLARLDAIGTSLWERLAEPLDPEQERAAIPDDGTPRVDTRHHWLDRLVGAGLLVIGE